MEDTDLLLVERAGTSYKLEKQDMSNLRDDDLLLVERGGDSYKVTFEDSGLGSGGGTLGGFEEPVEVLTPVNGAGMGLSPDPYEPISSLVTGAGANNGYYNVQFEDSTNLEKMVGPVEMRKPDGSEIFPETSAITSVTQTTSGTYTFGEVTGNSSGGVHWIHRMFLGQPSTGPHVGQDMLIILNENKSNTGYREFWYSLDYGVTVTKINVLGGGTQPRQGTNIDIVFFKGVFIIMSKDRTNASQFNISTEGSNTDWDYMDDPRKTLLGWEPDQTSAQVFDAFRILNNRLYMWSRRLGGFNLVYLDDWDEGWKLCTYSGEQIADIEYSCGQYILRFDKAQGITGFSDDGIIFDTIINDASYRAGGQESPPEYIIGYRGEEISYDGRVYKPRTKTPEGYGGLYDRRTHVFYKGDHPRLLSSGDGFNFVEDSQITGTNSDYIGNSHSPKFSGYTNNGDTIISFVYASKNNPPAGMRFGIYRVNGPSKSQEITFTDSKDLSFLTAGDIIEGTSEFITSIDIDNNKIVASNYTTTFTAGQTLAFPEKEAIADVVNNQTGNSLNVSGTNGVWYPGTVMIGASITDAAPSPGDIRFTSMNGGTTKVTGSNITLESRTWTLQEKQGDDWVTVVDAEVDISALATQDGGTPWSGRPTLKPSTEYRVLVAYNSDNADPSTSTYNTFTTGE